MRYNRFAISQIGGLKIVYNRRGDIVDMIGSVKGHRNYGYVYYNQYQNNNDSHYHNNATVSYNSNDYYYYKADGTKAKIEDKVENK